MKTLFITSVDDAAGKNMLLVGLGRQMQLDKHRVGFFKPIGNKPYREGRVLTDEDIVFFRRALGLDDNLRNACPLVLSDEIIARLFDPAMAGRTILGCPSAVSDKGALQPRIPGRKSFLQRPEYKSLCSNSRSIGKVMDNPAEAGPEAVSGLSGTSGRIATLMQRLAGEKDMMLIKGLGRFYRGSIFGLTESNLIKDFNWKTILIDGYRAGRLVLPADTIDGFIMAKKVLGNLLVGVIFNNVPPDQMDYLKKKIVPFLAKQHKIDVLGMIPKTDALRAVSIKELREMLGGELLCCKDKEDKLIERFCMSTMNVENDLRYFRQERCKAVVSSGDRTDVQLAALETPIECLILTGRLYPPDIILSRAEEKGVPVIVVRDDTLRTMRKIERLAQHLGIFTPSKVAQAIKIVKQNVDVKTIYKKI